MLHMKGEHRRRKVSFGPAALLLLAVTLPILFLGMRMRASLNISNDKFEKRDTRFDNHAGDVVDTDGARASSRLTLPEIYGGVHHLTVAGNSADDSQHCGTLHLFCKAAKLDRYYRLRCFTYFEAANWTQQPVLYGAYFGGAPFHMDMDIVTDNSSLKVEFEPVDDRRMASFQLDISEAAKSCDIYIPNWNKFLSLFHLLHEAHEWYTDTEPLRIIQAQKPLYGVALNRAGELFTALAEYNSHVGIDSFLLYSRPEQTKILESDRLILNLIKTGKLRVAHWLGVPLVWEPSKGGAGLMASRHRNGDEDMHLMIQHQVLSYWGTNTLLFIADQDEVLAFPKRNTTVKQLRDTGCLQQDYGAKWCAYFEKYDAFQERTDVKQPNDSIELKKFSYLTKDGLGSGKSLVHPSFSFQPDVHHTKECLGQVPACNRTLCHTSTCHEYRWCQSVESSCAFVAHVQNVVHQRGTYKDESLVVRNTSWLWMY